MFIIISHLKEIREILACHYCSGKNNIIDIFQNAVIQVSKTQTLSRISTTSVRLAAADKNKIISK